MLWRKKDLSIYERIFLSRKGKKDSEREGSFFELPFDDSMVIVVSDFMLGEKGVLWLTERLLILQKSYQRNEKKLLGELHKFSIDYNTRPIEFFPNTIDSGAVTTYDLRYNVYQTNIIEKADPVNLKRNILRENYNISSDIFLEHCKKRLQKYWESACAAGLSFRGQQPIQPPLEILLQLPQINFTLPKYEQSSTISTLENLFYNERR